MEILIVAPMPLILLGIIYGIKNIIKKNILEATTWGLVALIGFLLLTITMQSMTLTQQQVRIISLKNKIKELKKEKNLNKVASPNRETASLIHGR